MSVGIQLSLVFAIPLFLLYSTVLFCYGYRKGYDSGLDVARLIRGIYDEAESEE